MTCDACSQGIATTSEQSELIISLWLFRIYHFSYPYFITKLSLKLCEAYVWVMFRTAVCIFRSGECTFRSGERTFRSAEHRLDACSDIIMVALVNTLK